MGKLGHVQSTVNAHVPSVAKVGRATIHSPLPDSLGADLAKAASILEHFIKGNNQLDAAMIPAKIVANARGIAVITIFKAGFVWSGRAGSGVVVARLADGRWSAPSAIAAAGAGFGAQIGAQLTDCVFILNNDAAVKAFSHGGNVTFGGNLSVAAGPQGRSAEAAGAIVNLAPIYSYSKSKGLFAGVSLEGSIILTRNDTNRELYGRKVSAKEILDGSVLPPVQAEGLYRVLNHKFSNMGTGVVVSAPASRRAQSATLNKRGSPTVSVGDSLHRPGTAGAAPAQSPANAAAPAAGNAVAASPAAAGGLPTSKVGAYIPATQPATKRPPPPPPSAATRTNAPPVIWATALYDFNGERTSDLSFRRGERVQVVNSGGPSDWWTGRLNGKEGDFPGNYVQV